MNLFDEAGQQEESFWVEKAGIILSNILQCKLRIPKGHIYNQNFVCKHGTLFPFKRLKESLDWTWAKARHEGELG